MKTYKFEIELYSIDERTGEFDGNGMYTVVEMPVQYPSMKAFQRIFPPKQWLIRNFFAYTGDKGFEKNATEFYAELADRQEKAKEIEQEKHCHQIAVGYRRFKVYEVYCSFRCYKAFGRNKLS